MDQAQLAEVLVAMGCPAEKSAEMASQLDKRARQIMTEKGLGYEQSMGHLLGLMKQGWAAKDRGL
jgi:Xaa-Pro aminopeptidase